MRVRQVRLDVSCQRNLPFLALLFFSASVFIDTEVLGQEAFQDGNLIVSFQDPEGLFRGLGELREYDREGNVIQTITIPVPTGQTIEADQEVYDVDIDSRGRAVVHQVVDRGPRTVSIYDSRTGVWTHQPFGDQVGSRANRTQVGTAVIGDSVFLRNNRLDLETGELAVFSVDRTFPGLPSPIPSALVEISAGLDGNLYGIIDNSFPPSEVFVFDSETLEQLDQISLDASVVSFDDTRGIAVNADGNIFSADFSGRIIEYDRQGNSVNSLRPTDFATTFPIGNFGGFQLADIAISEDGAIAVTTTNRTLFLTDESLTTATSFELESGQSVSGAEHVAFAIAAVPEPSSTVFFAMAVTGIALRRKRSA